jgi:hypothetical protein
VGQEDASARFEDREPRRAQHLRDAAQAWGVGYVDRMAGGGARGRHSE